MSSTLSTVRPVFLKQTDIPDAENNRPTVLELCLAGERVTGQGSILGAQAIRGLWRLYPATAAARNDLLVKGIRLRDTSIQVSNDNPFILRDGSGAEKPSTKVWVDNIPLSVADTEVEHSLTKIGCELRSKIQLERARDSDNRLTRFLTGRRFLFITTPQTPLDKTLKVNIFQAHIFHKEQKQAKKPVVCSRCLQKDHHVSECKNEVVCRECGGAGHKRGDPACQLPDRSSGKQPDQEKPGSSQAQKEQSGLQSGLQSSQSAAASASTPAGSSSSSQRSSTGGRSRPLHRQHSQPSVLTPLSQLDRSSSASTKRSLSREKSGGNGEKAEKITKYNDKTSDQPSDKETETDNDEGDQTGWD